MCIRDRASGVPVNTTFGSITKPIDLLLEVIDMSADLIALIHEETELKKHHRACLLYTSRCV